MSFAKTAMKIISITADRAALNYEQRYWRRKKSVKQNEKEDLFCWKNLKKS